MITVLVGHPDVITPKTETFTDRHALIRVAKSGALEITNSFGEPFKVYAPGRWIEADRS